MELNGIDRVGRGEGKAKTAAAAVAAAAAMVFSEVDLEGITADWLVEDWKANSVANEARQVTTEKNGNQYSLLRRSSSSNSS